MRFGFLFCLALNFAGLLLAAKLFDGIFMTNYGWASLAALLLTILHLLLRPVLILLTLPLTLISMGLFLLIINALLFWLAGSMLEGYQVHGFSAALGGAVVVSVLGMLANWLAPSASARRKSGGNQAGFVFSRRPVSGARPAPEFNRPADDQVVDLEADKNGQWKIKD